MFAVFRRPLRLCCLCVPTFVSSLKISICSNNAFLLASKLVSDFGRTGSLVRDLTDLERSALDRSFPFFRASARFLSLWGDEDLVFLRRGSFFS